MGYRSQMRMRFSAPGNKVTAKKQLAFVKKVAQAYKQALISKATEGEVEWSGPYFANTLDYALDNSLVFSGDDGDYQGNYRAEVVVDQYYTQIDWDGKFYDEKWLSKLMEIIKDNNGYYSYVRIGEEPGDIDEQSGGLDAESIRVEYCTTTEFC